MNLALLDDQRRPVRRVLYAVALILFIATRYALLFRYQEYVSDMGLYRESAVKAISEGKSAYCDFHFPYPPLALPLVYLPALVALDEYGYRDAFHKVMFIFDATCFALIWLFLARRVRARPWTIFFSISLYSLLALAVGHLIYDRLDVAVMLSIAAAVYFFTGPPSSRPLAYIALAAGTLVKVMPAFILPLLFIFEGSAPQGTVSLLRRIRRVVLYFAGPIFIFIGIYLVAVCPGLIGSMQDHIQRGIQIESTWASPLLIAKILVPEMDISAGFSFGSFHLNGSISPFYMSAAKKLGIILLIGFYVAIARALRERGFFERKMFAAVFALGTYASVALTVATQRVLSPQFMIWLLPGAALLTAVVDRRATMALVASVLFVSTYGVFDLGFGALLEFQPWVVWLTTFRNVVLLLWSASLAVMTVRVIRRAQRSAGSYSE
jgi:hypothetical protein